MSESDTKTIIGVCCSPRPRESTYEAMSACLAAARETGGVTTRLIELAGKTVGPCLACGICKEGLICRPGGTGNRPQSGSARCGRRQTPCTLGGASTELVTTRARFPGRQPPGSSFAHDVSMR